MIIIKYQEIRRSNIQGIIEETINNGINNYDIAEFYTKCLNMILFVLVQNKLWYE